MSDFLKLRDLSVGTYFEFDDVGSDPYTKVMPGIVYEYRGNGWYGRPYDGGPWHDYINRRVIVRHAVDLLSRS